MINYLIELTAIAGFIYLAIGFLLSLSSQKKPQVIAPSPGNSRDIAAEQAEVVESATIDHTPEKGGAIILYEASQIVPVCPTSEEFIGLVQEAVMPTSDEFLGLVQQNLGVISLVPLEALMIHAICLSLPEFVPNEEGFSCEPSTRDSLIVDLGAEAVRKHWESVEIIVEEPPTGKPKTMPRTARTTIVAPATPSKKINVFDLRTLCQQNQIKWRNAKGVNKHLSATEMRTALKEKGVIA